MPLAPRRVCLSWHKATQEWAVGFNTFQRVIQLAQSDGDIDGLGDIKAVKVGISKLQVAPGTKAIVNRVEDCRLATVAGTNEAIDPRLWLPAKAHQASEIRDLDFANDRHTTMLQINVGW
jgi:hypothetical protein